MKTSTNTVILTLSSQRLFKKLRKYLYQALSKIISSWYLSVRNCPMSQGKKREQSGLTTVKKILNIFVMGFNLFQDFLMGF